METGTCCWLVAPTTPLAPITVPWKTKSFDLRILRGALHAEPKIKYMLAGFGGRGGEKDAAGLKWQQWCFIVFDRVAFLLGMCRTEMKAETMMGSRQTGTFCHR